MRKQANTIRNRARLAASQGAGREPVIWLQDPIALLAKAQALQPFVDEGLHLLDRAIEQYHPSKLFALFSGGYDSLCSTHVVANHPMFSGVLHINTGIGVAQTRHFVRDTCQTYNWPLFEYRSPIRYEDILLEGGFPGPPLHTMVYSKLKERAIRLFMRDQKQGLHDRILLATGARRQESLRRMGTTQDIRRDDTRIWVNPLINWTKTHILDYMEVNLLPHNEVVDLLHMSGECLCGCFAQDDEMMWLEIWYPETAAYIHTLEDQVLARGFPWRWGQSPPASWLAGRHGQESLPGFDLSFLPLCVSCDARFADLQEQLARPLQVHEEQSVPRIWTFTHNPLTHPPDQEVGVQESQEVGHGETPVRKKRQKQQPQDDIVGPWHPRDLRLLQQICAEHDMPFELMLALFQLEYRSYGKIDRTDVQAGIHALLSRDWSHVNAAVTNAQGQKLSEAMQPSPSSKPEQLVLW